MNTQMELCSKQLVSNLPSCCHGFLTRGSNFPPPSSLPLNNVSVSRHCCRARSTRFMRFSKLLPRAISEDSGPNEFAREERNGVMAVEEPPLGSSAYRGSEPAESPKVESVKEDSVDSLEETSDFLEKLNLKLAFLQLDSNDGYSIALYGGSALLVVWLASAVVGAIDSIPLIPKLLEVVGLGYTAWFTSRYLLFKNNREELAAKIEDLKQQVLGSDND